MRIVSERCRHHAGIARVSHHARALKPGNQAIERALCV